MNAQQLQSNYDELISYIEKYIESPRKEKVLDFYKQHEDRLILLPAAHKAAYHSAFAGGYVFHVNNVIKNALVSLDVWRRAGSNLVDITLDSVVFCALNHDLGKICLLYTSDAADDSLRVDLGGRRIIKKLIAM